MLKTPKRDEIPEQYKWNLKDIFESVEEWEKARKDCAALLDQLEELNAKAENSTSTAGNLLTYLKLSDRLDSIVEKVFVYTHLLSDENKKDSKRQELGQKLTPLSLKYSSVSSTFRTQLLALDGDTLNEYYQEEKDLQFYKKYFDELLRSKPHILSEKEELLLSQTGLLSSASTVFGMLNNADLTFPIIKNESGDDVQLTQGNYNQFLESKDINVRKQAFKALYSTFKKFENTIAATLHASNKKDAFYSIVRKYNSSLEASLFSDNVPVEVYSNLIKTVRNNNAPMKKYLELRKKMLGLEELHMYDLFTPLVKDLDLKISYEEAYETMKKALSVLGSDYVETLEEAYTGGWIDVYENEGKRNGAYQSGSYGVHPYVLLNHKDNLNSMFTLVHELGHAMHTHYSNANNEQLYAGYTIFAAEVASTVNEVLLMRYLLKNTEDKKVKTNLITYFLNQFRTTLYRQTMFAEFEKITHERVENGEPLTAENLSEIYYELNKDYHGDGIVHDAEIATEWSRIPHFYNAFYVYKYATGFSAAIALSKQILEEGEPAVERYINFLKSGGTDFPIELLKSAGVDLSTPKPIEEALHVFSELVSELESLI